MAPERNMKRKGGLVAKLKLSEPGKTLTVEAATLSF
jgi:hypothetical protein